MTGPGVSEARLARLWESGEQSQGCLPVLVWTTKGRALITLEKSRQRFCFKLANWGLKRLRLVAGG